MARWLCLVDWLHSNMNCSVKRKMMHRGQQDTAFQIFERSSESGTA
jgi:hypothetical protein